MSQEIILNALAEKVDELIKISKNSSSSTVNTDLNLEVKFLSKKVHDLTVQNEELVEQIKKDSDELNRNLTNGINSIKYNYKKSRNTTQKYDIDKLFKWMIFIGVILMFLFFSVVVYQGGSKEIQNRVEKLKTK